MNDDDPSADFGARVRARRTELGLSRRQVTDRDGPPEVTLAKIESGETRRPSKGTLISLDQVLSWAPGSAAKLLTSGTDPVALPVTHHQQTRQVLTADPGAPLTATRVVELTRVAHDLEDAITEYPGSDSLAAVSRSLNLVTDRFLRTWMIALLESTTDAPGNLPTDPLFDVMLSQYLRSPLATDLDEDDRTDVLYVRWLVGQLTEDDLDPPTQAMLQMRWASAKRLRE